MIFLEGMRSYFGINKVLDKKKQLVNLVILNITSINFVLKKERGQIMRTKFKQAIFIDSVKTATFNRILLWRPNFF